MIDTPQILQTERQAIAGIHIVVPRAQIQEVMGPALRELMAALADQKIAPAGPWLSHHLKNPSEVFDYVVAVPVDQPVTPVGRVTMRELPATRAARTIFHGDYGQLGSAWMALDAWIAAEGLTAAPWLYEVYLADPSVTPDPTAWRTQLTRPLVG